MSAPVEVTTYYVTTVDTLDEAWTFVMRRVDSVGPSPHVEITPQWHYHSGRADERDPERKFEVVVSGTRSEP